ncbi:MAG TPA: hemerythrin domain-containing protein [Candidatus Methylomirabilis sp.]|nr:hemerythrin domain-containing protein [Candidatus Methylomirabilis sp.]
MTHVDAIQFLKEEHQKAKAAFSKLLAAAPDRRGALWDALHPELQHHEEIEDTCLYGPLADERPLDPTLSEWVSDRHEEEVGDVESLIEKTEHLDPHGEHWLSIIRQIHTSLENHIRQEEGEIFPRITKVWDGARLTKAAEEMTGLKAGRH